MLIKWIDIKKDNKNKKKNLTFKIKSVFFSKLNSKLPQKEKVIIYKKKNNLEYVVIARNQCV